ncbi:ankyrin repeat-containing At5g02620-like [Olea europaea subsp. europaea]|uniref:Ankyrin repeat-containing At5g02620-like n=1 Tax=Olea europaea subsp. europaea TaxID=158383 RepID=A0A8S0PT83_OLEEU|nr:ankyrin repeat-containing At5g02620-like [Olea europaea subsp. europaea]
MARKRRMANERRRRKMRDYDSEPELESDNEESKLSHDDTCPPSDTQNYHSNSLEVKIESPISNEKARLIDQTSGKVNHQLLGPIYCLAALRGKWEDFQNAPSGCTNMELTDRGDRPLHVAAAAKQTALVHNLVKHLNISDLELRNKRGDTAFHFAALSGVVEMAEVMYKKNKNLPIIRSSIRMTPLEMAVLHGNREMVKYLYKITPIEVLNAYEYMEILAGIIHIDMYGTARRMLSDRKDSKIAFSPTNIGSVLKVLAQKSISHNHTIQERLWERLVIMIATIAYIPYFKRIYISLQTRRNASFLVHWLLKQILRSPDLDIISLIQETQVLYDAAKIGNVEFLTLLIQTFPDLIWRIDSRRSSIFHVAVINRQEKVYSLIHQTGVIKNVCTLYKDSDRNNILHLAGKRAPRSRLNIVSGPALQMQRELQWFEAVEKIVQPSYLQMKNRHGQTPRELFTVEHETLREDGEKWMKKTATSCMVVATLIATVVFAAAFTVPGGYKQEKGSPIFLKDVWFTVFVTSDAVAMFTSTASIMTFLSLFTAQFRKYDFLVSLPAKLMTGLFTLFASIVCMVVTFSATFILVYKEEKHGTWPKVVAALGLLPIILYVLLNCKLWIALIRSTFFASRSMFRLSNNMLFQ